MNQSINLGNTEVINFNGLEVDVLQLNGSEIWRHQLPTDEHEFKFISYTVKNVDTGVLEGSGLTLRFSTTVTYLHDFTVDWGDGTIEQHNDETLSNLAVSGLNYIDVKHSFPAGNEQKADTIFTVKIKGVCEQVSVVSGSAKGYFSTETNSETIYTGLYDILNINGTTKSMTDMFKDCAMIDYNNKNIIIALPKFNTPNCTSISGMFRYKDQNKNENPYIKRGVTIKIPDDCFRELTSCNSFEYMFYQDRDYDDKTSKSSINVSIGKNIFPDNVVSVQSMFQDCDIVSSIPEKLFYNLESLENMSYCFRGSDNTGFVLPSIWLPKNMSNVSTFEGFMGITGNSDKRYAKFYGTMENVWDRTDVNDLSLHGTTFEGAITLDNYNEIPSDWGGGGV